MTHLQKHKPFYNWLLLNNRRSPTAKRHCYNLDNLLQFDPHLTSDSFSAFIGYKKDHQCKNTYLNHLISTVRVYSQYLKEKGQFYDDELLSTRFLKREIFIKATMSDEEIEAFLSIQPPTITYKGRWGVMITRTINPRTHRLWTMFFSIMAFSGMRPGEVANLTVNDVDFGRDIFILRETKTGQPRLVPIAPNIKVSLQKFIAGLQSNYLFPSDRGGIKDGKAVFDNVDWHYNFHARIKRLGIKRTNLTPYSLRHSLITRLLEEDVNLFKVQKIVGHSDLRTTQAYTHLTTKDVQLALAKHPLIMLKTDPRVVLDNLKTLIKAFHLDKNPFFNFKMYEDKNGFKFEVKLKRKKL